jgi:error-prone DNA polymerase
MNARERLNADFSNTGMTIGPHPMSFHRQRMNSLGISTAAEIRQLPDGSHVRIAGSVICRQRPGTAKGFVFLTLEDETGISNAIVQPRLFDAVRVTLVSSPYLLVEGVLQNQQEVVSVKAETLEALDISLASVESHDFR